VDVASGTGAAARAAARAAGPAGRVLATDLSATMLARAALHAPGDGAAPIEYAVSPATALALPDGAFDVALCQQGLQFFDEPSRAVAELRRVLREGGVVAVAVWDAERRNEPFASFADAVLDEGFAEPFPGAFDAKSFTMAAGAVAELLSAAGFVSVAVGSVQRTARFDDAAHAAAAIMGTPYGALLARATDAVRVSVEHRVAERLGAGHGPLELVQAAVLARGVA